MKAIVRSSQHTRLRLALLLVLSLLFQQFALAAYACPLVSMPVSATTASTDCGGMLTPQQSQTSPLCAQDCAQQSLAAQDVRLPNVPPLLMPAWLPSPPLAMIAHISSTPIWSETTSVGTGIAPELRFRVLLI